MRIDGGLLPARGPQLVLDDLCGRKRVVAAVVMVEFADFRDSFAALPSGSLALDDVRTPEFCIYEDRRIVAYYAPFDYLNRLAKVALVGVTPRPHPDAGVVRCRARCPAGWAVRRGCAAGGEGTRELQRDAP